MDAGLRTASVSMAARMREHETLAHNAVNVNTDFFKESLMYYVQSEDGSLTTKRTVNQAAGALKDGSNLDLVLNSGTFLKLESQDGSIVFSKGGRLNINSAGQLCFGQYRVLDKNNREIVLNGAEKVNITANGYVVQAGMENSKLMLVTSEKADRIKQIGNNLYMIEGAIRESAALAPVVQGYAEDSNVDKGNLMTKMINAMRVYEAGQKALLSNDEALSRAINEFSKF